MRLILFYFLISISIEQKPKESILFKHGEDCVLNTDCEEGLICKNYRCFTEFESNNLYELGLLDNNICDNENKCPENQQCVKHRCLDNNPKIELIENKTENIDSIHLLFSGGLILNKNLYLSGMKADNTFNYEHLFTHISKDIKSADFSIIPQQSIFYINEDKNSSIGNYLDTPIELGDAIADAGFKGVLYANPRAFLKKEKGIIDTINFWKTKYPDVRSIGIASTMEEIDNYFVLLKKNNIKIGIINYSGFEINIPEDKSFMINTLSRKKIERWVNEIRNKVDFIIVCIDWGDINSYNANIIQINWAKRLASFGVNLIIGNHPLYVQPVSYVRASNGNSTLVFFSLGTLDGDNLKETFNLGALANIVISKLNGKAYISSYNLIPTINHESKVDYSIYKLTDYNEGLGKEIKKDFSLEKIKKLCKKIMQPFAYCG